MTECPIGESALQYRVEARQSLFNGYFRLACFVIVTTADVEVLMKLLLCNHLKNHIHCSHVIHIYNYIPATRAIITTITTREPIIQLAVALRKCSLIIYTNFFEITAPLKCHLMCFCQLIATNDTLQYLVVW